MRTRNPAGPAFQTALIVYMDVVIVEFIYVRRAEIETWLFQTVARTGFSIPYP
jgi:hypothetical protein